MLINCDEKNLIINLRKAKIPVASALEILQVDKDEKILLKALRKAEIPVNSVLDILMDWFDPEKNDPESLDQDLREACEWVTAILKEAYEKWQQNG